jgi:hypothetical protein
MKRRLAQAAQRLVPTIVRLAMAKMAKNVVSPWWIVNGTKTIRQNTADFLRSLEFKYKIFFASNYQKKCSQRRTSKTARNDFHILERDAKHRSRANRAFERDRAVHQFGKALADGES